MLSLRLALWTSIGRSIFHCMNLKTAVSATGSKGYGKTRQKEPCEAVKRLRKEWVEVKAPLQTTTAHGTDKRLWEEKARDTEEEEAIRQLDENQLKER
mmetsp:Transcript_9579/g.17774  ORF Transcript_9579/g.17774 Transcript_9579/m.17774 type:complete len:98 (+) Transcript_9579:1108-1401(+)